MLPWTQIEIDDLIYLSQHWRPQFYEHQELGVCHCQQTEFLNAQTRSTPKACCSLSGPSMWSLAFATWGINLCFEGWSFKGGSYSPILSWLQNSEPQQWALPETPTVKIMKLWLTALPSQGPFQNLGPYCVFGILNPLYWVLLIVWQLSPLYCDLLEKIPENLSWWKHKN